VIVIVNRMNSIYNYDVNKSLLNAEHFDDSLALTLFKSLELRMQVNRPTIIIVSVISPALDPRNPRAFISSTHRVLVVHVHRLYWLIAQP